MLNNYLNLTGLLLQNPASPSTLYSTANLTTFINEARGQLAGDSESVRVQGAISTVVGQRVYQFANINVTSVAGVAGVFNVRQMMIGQASGTVWVRPRSFEWFTFYRLNNPVPPSGPPNEWSQYAQGEIGSFYLDPLPDSIYNLTLDCTCVPISLVLDTDPEAIPYPWTDCVPYFAAYLALLASQVPARQADADRMLQRYNEFKDRARKYSTPGVLPTIYPQNPSPVTQNQLGLARGR